MNLLFVADPLESFKPYKDSTFAMMREAASRGHGLWACEPAHLHWQRGAPVRARVQGLRLTGALDDWFEATDAESRALADFDAVLMRKDPPFDSEYFYATHLLSRAEADGARVFNAPRALRDHPEKLAILEFPQFIGPTLVTRAAADVRAFHAQHRDIILQAAGRHGRHGHLPCRARRVEPGQHRRNAEPRRRADADGAALPARDRQGRQAHPRHRRRAGAVLAGAHPSGHGNPRQPGGRRQGCGDAFDRRASARLPSPSGRCWPSAACCWWGWT